MADVWFDYVPTGTGSAVLSTCGLVDGIFGTTITVYAACGGEELGCDSGTCFDLQATVAVPVIAGQHYLVRLASLDAQTPSGSMSILLAPQCSAPAPGAPANDCCATATPIGNGTFAFTTVGASRDYTGPCDLTNNHADVWFDYTAATTGFSKVRPEPDAPEDLGVTVLDGACGGPEVACAADFVFIGDTRQVVFPTVAGQHYLVRIFGVSADSASGHVTFATALPPPNDDCTGATPISGLGVFPYDNTLANNSGPDDAPACDGFGGMIIAHDVWFRWTSTLPPGQDAVVETCGGTRVDTKIAVYAFACPPGAPLDCNDDVCFLQSRVRFTPTPGASYLLRIGNWPGFNGDDGPDGKPGAFTISQAPTCTIAPPPGAFIEPEPCGQSINDGFDLDCATTGSFTDLPCGITTVFGTAPVLGDIPDQDMYRVTIQSPSHVVFSGTAEFPMLLGVLGTDCPQSVFVRWRFPSGICEDPQLNPIEMDLDPGTYAFAVVNTRITSTCDARNNYLVTISITNPADFDRNGVVEPADIAAFVNLWFSSLTNGTLEGDWDQNGAIEPADIASFVNAWFSALSSGGC